MTPELSQDGSGEIENNAIPPPAKVLHRDAGTQRSGLLRGRTREQETRASPRYGVPVLCSLQWCIEGEFRFMLNDTGKGIPASTFIGMNLRALLHCEAGVE
jgi:hypothetical protein